jgi:hypothetical protein
MMLDLAGGGIKPRSRKVAALPADFSEDAMIRSNADRRGLARTAGRNAQIAAKIRIQPRRGGARVAARNTTCVQAALHTGAGRCACGWHTEGF